MLLRNNSGESKVNATWDNLAASNLAPKSIQQTKQACEPQGTSSSRLSNMAKNMSFEKFSQVFSNSTNNLVKINSRKLPSSSLDLKRNQRQASGPSNEQKAASLQKESVGAANTNQQKLLLLQHVQKTMQEEIARSGETLNNNGTTKVNPPNANPMLSNRLFQSCNNMRAGLTSNGNAGWDLNTLQRQQSAANTNARANPSMASASSFQRSRYSYSSQSRTNMPPPVPENGSTGNQEWGTFPTNTAQTQLQNAAPQQQQQKSANIFQNMLTKDGEIDDLLQTLKSKQGPVTQHGQNNVVNEFVQPHDFDLRPRNRARGSASVNCCMNELSLRKTPSHSTLRPSRSILLQAKYSNNDLASLCNNTTSSSSRAERPMRRSSSNVSFTASSSVHEFSTADYDKSMWYSQEEERQMAIDAFRKKQKRAKKKALRRKSREGGASSPTSCSSSNGLGEEHNDVSTTNNLSSLKHSTSSRNSSFCSNLSIAQNEPNKRELDESATKIEVVKPVPSLDKMLNGSTTTGMADQQPKKSKKVKVPCVTPSEDTRGELLVDWAR